MCVLGEGEGNLRVDEMGLNLFFLMNRNFHIVKKNYLGVNVLSSSSL